MFNKIISFCACPVCNGNVTLAYVSDFIPYGLVCNSCGHTLPIKVDYLNTNYLHGVLSAVEYLRSTKHSEECILDYLQAAYIGAQEFALSGMNIAMAADRTEDANIFMHGFKQYKRLTGRLRLQFVLIEMGCSPVQGGYLTNDNYECLN